jgi:Mn2+/Fe2+ NRAMP family transporter
MVVLLLANLANTVANVAGAASAMAIFNVPILLTAPLSALIVWLLVVYGSYRSVERIFLALTAVFLAYIAAALLANPNWAAVASSLTTPSLAGVSGPEMLLLVAVVGTTVTPYMQFYLQSAVAEKGIGVEGLGAARADAILGSIWTNFIAACVVIATAVALGSLGQPLGSAAELHAPRLVATAMATSSAVNRFIVRLYLQAIDEGDVHGSTTWGSRRSPHPRGAT